MKTKICVEQLGICWVCDRPISLEKLTAQQAIAQNRKCVYCSSPLDWNSLGMEISSVDGAFYKVRWVGPDGKWTKEKPTHPFHLAYWYVTPGIFFNKTIPTLPPEAVRLYVAWCQKWSRTLESGEVLSCGYSLHKNISLLRKYVSEKTRDDSGLSADGGPYQCLVSRSDFRDINNPYYGGGVFEPLPLSAPKPHKRKNLGENVLEMIVAA